MTPVDTFWWLLLGSTPKRNLSLFGTNGTSDRTKLCFLMNKPLTARRAAKKTDHLLNVLAHANTPQDAKTDFADSEDTLCYGKGAISCSKKPHNDLLI